MKNKFVILKQEEVNAVFGGNLIEAGKIFLETFLNTGTALAIIGTLEVVHQKICTPDTSWVRSCAASKQMFGIVGFTMHSLIPIIYKGLADPILPTREHAD